MAQLTQGSEGQRENVSKEMVLKLNLEGEVGVDKLAGTWEDGAVGIKMLSIGRLGGSVG